MTGPRDFDAERRRIIRRMTLLTWGLWGAAAVLAVAGGAVVAWMLEDSGLPFRTTWIVVAVLLLVVPAVAQIYSNRRAD